MQESHARLLRAKHRAPARFPYRRPVISSSIFCLSIFLFSLPNLSRLTLDVYHTSIHRVTVT